MLGSAEVNNRHEEDLNSVPDSSQRIKNFDKNGKYNGKKSSV